jgi:hypothetical protein
VARRRPRPALPFLPAAARMHVEILLRTVSISTQNRYSVLLRYVSHNVHTVTVERTRTPSAAHQLQVAGVSAHAHCCGQEGQVAKFLAAFARRGEPVAYVDVMKAFIYLQVARPSPCLRAPAGRVLARDMPCTMPCVLHSHCSQMQATDGNVDAAVKAYREVRVQAAPAERAGDAHASHTACQVADLQEQAARAQGPPVIELSSRYGPPLARSAARQAPLPCRHAWQQSRRRLQSPEAACPFRCSEASAPASPRDPHPTSEVLALFCIGLVHHSALRLCGRTHVEAHVREHRDTLTHTQTHVCDVCVGRCSLYSRYVLCTDVHAHVHTHANTHTDLHRHTLHACTCRSKSRATKQAETEPQQPRPQPRRRQRRCLPRARDRLVRPSVW